MGLPCGRRGGSMNMEHGEIKIMHYVSDLILTKFTKE